MPTLHFALLGPPQIRLDDEPLQLRPRNSIKAKGILYYLAATGHPASRERLAGLLWSESTEKKARDNLRGELFLLAALRDGYLTEVDGRLALRAETCTVDKRVFEAVAADQDPTLEAIDEACRLWRGAF